MILEFRAGNLPKLIHKDIYCCNCCAIRYSLNRNFFPAFSSSETIRGMIKSKAPHESGKSGDPPKKNEKTFLNRSKWSKVETFLGASAYQVHSRRCIQRVQWACCSQSQIKTSWKKYRTLSQVLGPLRIWSEKNENSQNQKGAAAFERLIFKNMFCQRKAKTLIR